MTFDDLEIELKILSRYYTAFKFDNANTFISSFEDIKSRDLITQKYIEIATKNNEPVYIINSQELFSEIIASNIKDAVLNGRKKYLDNATVIIDLYENKNMDNIFKNLLNYYSHIRKNTEINLHLMVEPEMIRDYIAGSDIWEFRTKTFHYPYRMVEKFFLKETLEKDLNPSATKKQLKI